METLVVRYENAKTLEEGLTYHFALGYKVVQRFEMHGELVLVLERPKTPTGKAAFF